MVLAPGAAPAPDFAVRPSAVMICHLRRRPQVHSGKVPHVTLVGGSSYRIIFSTTLLTSILDIRSRKKKVSVLCLLLHTY